jgi:hypothetical protein
MIKQLLNGIVSFFLKLYIRYKGRDAALRKATKKARKLHRKTGKRYRVFFLANKYQVITRNDIQHRKHAKDWARHVNSTNLQPLCFFDTNSIHSPKTKTNGFSK